MPTKRKAPTDGGGDGLEWSVKQTIQALMNQRGWSQSEMYRRAGPELGLSRQSVAAKLAGKTKLSLTEIEVFARHLDVPPHVFLMTPQDAQRWVLDNRTFGPVVPLRRRVSASGQSARTRRVAGGRARAAHRRTDGFTPKGSIAEGGSHSRRSSPPALRLVDSTSAA